MRRKNGQYAAAAALALAATALAAPANAAVTALAAAPAHLPANAPANTPANVAVTVSANENGPVSSAYGIAADGLIAIPRTPEVSSDSPPYSRSVFSIPGNPLVELSVLKARAVPGHATASVVDLKIAKAAISPDAALTAKLITARCDDGVGSSRLVDVRLAGRPIGLKATPNSTLTVPIAGIGDAQVTINKQVRNPDGSVTVTGLELAVRALGHSQVVAISSATCAGGEAPRPAPVPRDLPVTG